MENKIFCKNRNIQLGRINVMDMCDKRPEIGTQYSVAVANYTQYWFALRDKIF
jgi:hypothetical protein